MAPNGETESRQETFSQLHGDELKSSSKLVKWVSDLLGGVDVKHYASNADSASKQLKNKLAQAGGNTAKPLLLLTSFNDVAADRAASSVVRNWVRSHWNPRPSAVGIVSQRDDGQWTVKDIIYRTNDAVAHKLAQELFPEARIHRAEGAGEEERGETPSLEDLSAELRLPLAWIEEVVDVLLTYKSVIFYGPPGTGKTYVARKLASVLQPEKKFRKLVQFHPSYGYEQFIEGYRPSPSSSGGMNLVKVPGPLKRLVDSMVEGDEDRGILVLDEINRANLAKVFGELYYLLEYREEEVELMYSEWKDGVGETFSLPDGLLLIGTMNTADRSVAMVDQALRRRFKMIPFNPTKPPIGDSEDGTPGVLRSYLLDEHPELVRLADVVNQANALLSDPDWSIGPSHFMREDLDFTEAARIWEFTVLPAIAMRIAGTRWSASEFEFQKLWDQGE